jgi:hypothetical protein
MGLLTENDVLMLVEEYSPPLADVVKRLLEETQARFPAVPDGAAVVAKSDLELLLNLPRQQVTAPAEISARHRLSAAVHGYAAGPDAPASSAPLPPANTPREQAARKAHEMYWNAVPHSPAWQAPGMAQLWQDIVVMVLSRTKVSL